MRQRELFRQMLREPGIEIQPAVYDPLGARIAEDVGFTLIGIGGYAVGAHLATSEPLTSLDDMARITRQISLVCNLPIMVDAGAGWGEPLHVMHTVRVLEQAGAASIHLEDQYFPKRVQYHRGVEEVIPTDEMVLKIRAALQARRDPEFAIVARSDAMRTHDYDEGIRRARAYVEAGADAILLFPNTEEETKAVPKDLPGVPLVYVNSTGNRFGRGVFSAAKLGAWGWKIVFDAISTTNVAAHAIKSYMSTLKQTGEPGLDPEQVTAGRLDVERIIGLNELYDLEKATTRTQAGVR
jgi:2-methylisocitrate lyase-like PEP mutase family enzyme